MRNGPFSRSCQKWPASRKTRPKIVEGMLAKRFFAETVLEDQAWIHDPDRTVGKALAEHGAEVREFVRRAVAESQG